MIEVLIVDDSARKAARVKEEILRLLPDDWVRISVADCVVGALDYLERVSVDLMVLDLLVPWRQGETPASDAGVRMLHELKRTRRTRMPEHIVGLTAFAHLHEQHEDAFHFDLWHLVQYSDADDEWVQHVSRKVLHLANVRYGPSAQYDFDLAIVTAVEDVELAAVLNLPGGWNGREFLGDSTIYHIGQFADAQTILKVAAACTIEMGMPAATALSMKMIERFRPRYLAIVGIAAGIAGEYGDILVADQSWDYGSGKIRHLEDGIDRFAPAPSPIPLDPLSKARLRHFAGDSKVSADIANGWQDERPAQLPRVHIGPMASGAAVVESRPLVEEIKAHQRKLVGVEMETYGVFMAARCCTEPRPNVLSMKALCDYADENKCDKYQRYAAYTSATFMYKFALAHLGTGKRA